MSDAGGGSKLWRTGMIAFIALAGLADNRVLVIQQAKRNRDARRRTWRGKLGLGRVPLGLSGSWLLQSRPCRVLLQAVGRVSHGSGRD